LAITRERKEALVAQYTDLLKRSEAVILTNYLGLNVAQVTQLRDRIREANGAYYVTKNTLIKLAMQQLDLSVHDEWLEGPTAIGFCFDDVTAVAKAIAGFADESEILAIKGALLGSRAVGEDQIVRLAKLPPVEVLRAQVLGALTAPMSGVVGALNNVLAGLVSVLDARKDQLGEPEAA
jgi:large subunit ribosomal protein L10